MDFEDIKCNVCESVFEIQMAHDGGICDLLKGRGYALRFTCPRCHMGMAARITFNETIYDDFEGDDVADGTDKE